MVVVLVATPAHPAVRPSWKDRIAPYRAVVLDAAAANAERPNAERAAGDRLADLYLKRATSLLRARVTDLDDPKAVRAEVQAWCVAMGVVMDRTGALATNPMARLALGDVESKEDRAARNRVLGDPSLRGRSDWLRHFWVSCALRAIAGRSMAEHAGVSKELADAQRQSGFSLADLCAG